MTNRPVTRAMACLTALAVILTSNSSAFAWGPQGHRVIAKVAETRLSPAAKAAIKDLLHPGDTLDSIAGWADTEGHTAVPASASWHYINVPVSDKHFDPKLIHNDDNVVVQIEHFRKVLADRSKPKQDRQRALLFLVHFVSDIHQPLHVGDNNDKGGNLTQVQFFNEGTNLHRLWDSDLIHKIGGNDRAWLDRIERQITPQTIKEWSKGNVDEWAEESLQAAKVAYRQTSTDPHPFASGVTLGEPYLKRMEPFLIEQMARASVRLANELNGILK
jgi:hypothetical protein